MQDSLNRVGLTLQFLSLWLVTPQIIGEQRMTEYAEEVHRQLNTVRRFITNHFGMTLLGVVVISGILRLTPYDSLIAHALGKPRNEFLKFVAYWLPGLASLLSTIAAVLVVYLASMALARLTDGVRWLASSSQSYLILGALLFTVGFGFLLGATWVPSHPT